MNLRYLVVVPLAVLLSFPVYAQDNAQAALARAQGMLRQISAQKGALEKQVADLKHQLEEAQGKLDSQIKKSQNREGKFKGAISEWKAQYAELQERFMKTVDTLRATSGERDKLSGQLAATTKNFDTCYANNHKLVILSQKLLGDYRDKGIWAALWQREPVTGFGKVETENLVQTYQHAIEDRDLKVSQYQLQDVKQ